MIEFLNFYLIPALTLGAIYALGAVGISMIFGILRFAHFAHGDVMTLGAYGTLTAVWLIPAAASAAAALRHRARNRGDIGGRSPVLSALAQARRPSTR